jgi:arylsulfatase A-like enzyme
LLIRLRPSMLTGGKRGRHDPQTQQVSPKEGIAMHRTLIALAVFLSSLGVIPSLAADAAEGVKPNILHIHADDHRPDGLHALGTEVLQTPNLDTLVRRGTTFTRAYTQGSMIGAVCTPSRTMMLTGRSWQRIPGAPKAAANAGDPATFLPRVLAAAGYQTWHMGKRSNSFLAGINAFQTSYFDEGGRAGSSRRLADKTIAFLKARSASKEARPFYIYLAPPVPHDPRMAEPQFHKLYDPARVPLSPAFLPQHPFDNGEMTVRDEKLAPWPRTPENTRKQLADYYACISGLDHHVGRIFDELKRLGQWDNTLVVFSGDNGLSLGEHGLFGKQNLYEYGGMHVPLVFAGPGIPRGKSDALVYLMDLFPTFADYAGAKLPDGVEGQSLRPILSGKKAKVRGVLYTGYRDCMRSIRDDRWKLIRYPLVDRTQLFDLQNDPRELNNLADRPEQAPKVAELTRLLEKEMERYGDKHPLRVPKPRPAEWSPPRSRLSGTKPNMVFLLTDYQGYGDLSAHGAVIVRLATRDLAKAT